MRIAIRITQFLVAILFIFSGLVKANDPLGLAYKMEEFFDLWITGLNNGHFFAADALVSLLTFLNQHNLFLSIAMITLEIVTGVALLLGWRKRFILWLLLVLIVFFTFLTGYAYLSGKFSNCGCFGDCLPITPKTSYAKDVVLLFLIVFLVIGSRYIKPFFANATRSAIIATALVFSLALQWYVLNYLPLVDCLPMKKGNNIMAQITPPPDAIPSVYESTLVYENTKTGALKEMSQADFNASKIWEDPDWKWKETKTKLIRQGTDIPKMQGFSLTTAEGNDITQEVLNEQDAVLYFVNSKNNHDLIDQELVTVTKAKGVGGYFVTTERQAFGTNTAFPVLTCDGTIFRIAARVNPTVYLLHKGNIVGKWPLAQIDAAEEKIKQLKP